MWTGKELPIKTVSITISVEEKTGLRSVRLVLTNCRELAIL